MKTTTKFIDLMQSINHSSDGSSSSTERLLFIWHINVNHNTINGTKHWAPNIHTVSSGNSSIDVNIKSNSKSSHWDAWERKREQERERAIEKCYVFNLTATEVNHRVWRTHTRTQTIQVDTANWTYENFSRFSFSVVVMCINKIKWNSTKVKRILLLLLEVCVSSTEKKLRWKLMFEIVCEFSSIFVISYSRLCSWVRLVFLLCFILRPLNQLPLTNLCNFVPFWSDRLCISVKKTPFYCFGFWMAMSKGNDVKSADKCAPPCVSRFQCIFAQVRLGQSNAFPIEVTTNCPFIHCFCVWHFQVLAATFKCFSLPKIVTAVLKLEL